MNTVSKQTELNFYTKNSNIQNEGFKFKYEAKNKKIWGSLIIYNCGPLKTSPCEIVEGMRKDGTKLLNEKYSSPSKAIKALIGYGNAGKTWKDNDGKRLEEYEEYCVGNKKFQVCKTKSTPLEFKSALEKVIENSNFITNCNEQIRSGLLLYFNKFDYEKTLLQTKSSIGSNSIGNLNGFLSRAVNNLLIENLSEDNEEFKCADEDGIDFKFGEWEGDFKTSFSNNNIWAVNGSSHKRGSIVLTKFILEENVLLKDVFMKKFFCAIVPVDCIDVDRSKGKSDRAQLRIPCKYRFNVDVLAGNINRFRNTKDGKSKSENIYLKIICKNV